MAESQLVAFLLQENLTVHDLISKAKLYNPVADEALIAKAYAFAEHMHAGQFRRSGEPYFVHPVGVASIIADMRLDTASIVTGLLHDTVEDTVASLDQVRERMRMSVVRNGPGDTALRSPPRKSSF